MDAGAENVGALGGVDITHAEEHAVFGLHLGEKSKKFLISEGEAHERGERHAVDVAAG